jgi:MFS family permease
MRVMRMRDVPWRSWKALIAAGAGWMLDSMDFLLFTFAIRAIQKDFSLSDGSMGMLMSVALFASAAGGLLFGRLADRIGRVRAMTWSIILYSVATGGMATSMSFTMLVFWRVLVGLGMGGEWSCGSVLVAETWPAKHRAKAIGLMQSGWALGALAAAGLSALILEQHGWRILFVIGVFPALIALWIRRTVDEPEMWEQLKAEAPTARPSDLFRGELAKKTLVATAVASSVLVAYWGLMTWLPSFLATPVEQGGAGMTITRSALWMILVQTGAFAGYVTFGLIADRIGRRPAFSFFMVGALVTIPVYVTAASKSEMVLLFVGPLLGYFAHGYFSVFGALLAELFPTAIRATGQGFCYNVGRLFSAMSPYLIGRAAEQGGLGLALSVNALFFGLAGVLIWLLPETREVELESLGEARA